METKPLIVIVGPTASGKTSLAITLAKHFGGEIICADSRTVYEGMDIGTAKPTADERAQVQHWGLDLVKPDQNYTVAEFKEYADRKIKEIRDRGRIPFLVGGSGLYIDSVIFDYEFGEPADLDLRRKLEMLSVEDLQDYCRKNSIEIPQNSNNKRHLVRAIEQKGINNKRKREPVENSFIFGIETDREVLKERITKRATEMFNNDVVHEAEYLAEKYGWQHEAMTGNIYPLCHAVLEGTIDMVEAREKFIVQDWRLVKRQLTWFKRNSYITWLPLDETEKRIISLLDSEH